MQDECNKRMYYYIIGFTYLNYFVIYVINCGFCQLKCKYISNPSPELNVIILSDSTEHENEINSVNNN